VPQPSELSRADTAASSRWRSAWRRCSRWASVSFARRLIARPSGPRCARPSLGGAHRAAGRACACATARASARAGCLRAGRPAPRKGGGRTSVEHRGLREVRAPPGVGPLPAARTPTRACHPRAAGGPHPANRNTARRVTPSCLTATELADYDYSSSLNALVVVFSKRETRAERPVFSLVSAAELARNALAGGGGRKEVQ